MRDWLNALFVAVESYEYLLRMMVPSKGDFFVGVVNKYVFIGETLTLRNSHSPAIHLDAHFLIADHFARPVVIDVASRLEAGIFVVYPKQLPRRPGDKKFRARGVVSVEQCKCGQDHNRRNNINYCLDREIHH